MAKNTTCRIALPKQDLDFVVQTVTPEAKSKTQLKQLINEDQSFREGLLSDAKLFRRVTSSPPLILGISPLLFFEVLLRRAVAEMKEATHTVERTVSLRIPVFDINEVLELLEEDDVFYYLVHLLVTFVRYERGAASDIEIDRLIKLGRAAKGDRHFLICKRIADVCLFILGIFPEYVMYDYIYLFSKKKLPLSGEPRKSMGDYEALGQEFYALASEHETAKIRGTRETLRLLSKNFYLAKKPLNLVSEHYLAIAAKNP